MFSIIVPVYNKLPHLERSIDSVLNQTFTDFELILIDDASTDGSSDKIKSLTDSRIKCLSRTIPGPGGYAARNLGIQNARHEWICFLDADDAWHPDFLTEVHAAISLQAHADFITVGWEKSENQPNVKRTLSQTASFCAFTLKDYLLNHTFVWTGAVTVRKELIQKVGMFPTDERCKRGGDVDTWIRCLTASRRNIKIGRVLAWYYQDTVNRVTDSSKNPTQHFCAYDTLMNVYHTSSEEDLKDVIRKYINIKIYQIMKRSPRIEFALLTKMFPNAYSLINVPKLILKKLIRP